jgi:hypothetical protein
MGMEGIAGVVVAAAGGGALVAGCWAVCAITGALSSSAMLAAPIATAKCLIDVHFDMEMLP